MIVTTELELKQLVEDYLRYDSFCFDVETRATPESNSIGALDVLTNEVFWIGLSTYGRVDAIPMGHRYGKMLKPERFELVLPPEDQRKVLKNGELSMSRVKRKMPAEYASPPEQLYPEAVFDALRPLFFSDRRKIGHNVKFDIKTVTKYFGGDLMPGPFAEGMVAEHLLDENHMKYGLLDATMRLLGPGTKYEKIGKFVNDVEYKVAAQYVQRDARYTWLNWRKLSASLEKRGFMPLFNMEMDVLACLISMELEGVLIDSAALSTLGDELRAIIQDIEDRLYVFNNNHPFQIGSNLEKGRFVYETRGHDAWRLTGTGKPSVDKIALESFIADPAVNLLLEWAEVEKLRSTYVDGLLPLLDKNGRVHTSFNQARAVTGRFSSSEPNLQNIPRVDDSDPTDKGSLLRALFVCPPGYSMIVADWDQIELRWIAYFSKDPVMTETFVSGLDIHRAVAAQVLNIPMEAVSHEQRQIGKSLNFATGFGAGPAKVASMIGSTEEQGKAFLDSYFKRFNRIQEWKKKELSKARQMRPPSTFTIMGRQRRLPELIWSDRNAKTQEEAKRIRGLRSRAERQAINHIVQGSAGDLMKLAIIRAHKFTDGKPMTPVLTVHDELITYVKHGHEEEGVELIQKAMGGLKLLGDIPLVVSIKVADRWSEGK